jgi:putative flippase GtrA
MEKSCSLITVGWITKITVSFQVVCAKFSPYLCRFMKAAFYRNRDRIIRVIDFFYPPFSKVMDKQTFRYAASGGSNTLFDIVLYFLTYNFVLDKKIIYIGNQAISPHIAAFLFTFPITFISGFTLMRYVVFPESAGTRKRIQMIKYLGVVFICILLNYIFLKFFVEVMGWWPLPSKIVTTFFVVAFSYISQKKFAFKATGSEIKIN